MDQTNHCGSFQPNPFCDSVTVNIYFAWRITFPLLSLLLGFWFKFLPWRQGSVHLHCQLERRNLRVVNVPVGHSQKSKKVPGLCPQGEGEGLVAVVLVMLYFHSHREEHKG